MFITAFYLPEWCPGSKYVTLLKEAGLQDVRVEDWSEQVKPFWPAVIKSALQPWNLLRVLQGGWLMTRAAWASVSIIILHIMLTLRLN